MGISRVFLVSRVIQPHSPSGCSKIHPRSNHNVYSVNRRFLTHNWAPHPPMLHCLLYIYEKLIHIFNKHPPTTKNQNLHFNLTFPVHSIIIFFVQHQTPIYWCTSLLNENQNASNFGSVQFGFLRFKQE